MPKKTCKRQANECKCKDVSNVSGNVNVADGSITTHRTVTGLNAVQIKQLFHQLYIAIETNAHGPDIPDVVVATLVNPLDRLRVVVKKIAEKTKEDTK